MTPSTLFDVASITKPVAATTVALSLLEEGRLHLEDPLVEFVPEFGRPPEGRTEEAEWRRGVTLRHLLTHTAGVSAGRNLRKEGVRDREGIVAAVCATPLNAPPGSRVEYSCFGYILLGAALERIAGQDLDRLARERVFAPLGMRDTGYRPDPALRERIAATELDPETGEILWGVVHDENARSMGGVSGNAGLFSTAPDLAVFGRMYLNGGVWRDQRILAAATVAAAIRDHTGPLGAPRGLGWVVRGTTPASSAGDLISPRAFGHTGFTGTSLWMDPDRDLIVVLLTNRVHPTRENRVMDRLRPLFHNAVLAAVTG